MDAMEELVDLSKIALEDIAIFSKGLDIPPSLSYTNVINPRECGHLGKNWESLPKLYSCSYKGRKHKIYDTNTLVHSIHMLLH